MTYSELKKKTQKMFDDFHEKYAFFAFNDEQFEDGKKKLNVSKDNKITPIYGGGFVLSSKVNEYRELIAKASQMEKDFAKTEKGLESMLWYELANHEYVVTYDLDDTLEACNLTDEYNNDENVRKSVDKIARDFLKRQEEAYGW